VMSTCAKTETLGKSRMMASSTVRLKADTTYERPKT
jgi:hypothetical protein